MGNQELTYQRWVPVIGRSLAYLCMQLGEVKDKNLAEKATFLETLGVERKDAAVMLGSTYGSITEALSKVKRSKKGAKRSANKTRSKKDT